MKFCLGRTHGEIQRLGNFGRRILDGQFSFRKALQWNLRIRRLENLGRKIEGNFSSFPSHSKI